jgi:tRNA threonylcarbamoyladenosine biosynthesis protein TsaB
MALILSIETSGDNCSVAIHEKNILLSSSQVAEPRSHATKLGILLEEVIKNSGVSKSLLSAIAVSAGPGSYTGLRIGTATAKGLCYGLNIPLIAVNTLDILIYRAKNIVNSNSPLLCPMIDARRMEVYCKIVDHDDREIQEMKPVVVDNYAFKDLLDEHPIHFFGSGAGKCKDLIHHQHAIFNEGIFPDASALGALAFEKWNRKETENVRSFEPLYLKEFVAKKALSRSVD